LIECVSVLLVLGAAFAVASSEFVDRCLGLKLAGDALAILVLAYGPKDNGDIRGVNLSIIAITTGLVFLLIVVGRRHFSRSRARNS